MLNSIILLGGLVSAFGLGAISPIQEKQYNVQFKLENHKSVQYDDVNHSITLSASELNNYTWNNFNNAIVSIDLFDVSLFYLEYNGDLVTPSSSTFYEGEYFCFQAEFDNSEFIVFFNEGYVEDFDGYERNVFTNDSGDEFEYSLIIDMDELNNYYAQIKQAIELDIQANQPNNDYSPILGDIVSLLVGGISSFSGGLGAGVSALVGDIFINNGSLSVFGYMVVIFAGIALAIGLSRWVMNFLTSLGAKK